jgi:hypothetical protein
MFWSIIGLIGGGSFVATGFNVLTSPSCDTVGFGGGRAVQVTCYEAGAALSGDFPGTVAGLGMLAAGGLILYFAWRNFKRR